MPRFLPRLATLALALVAAPVLADGGGAHHDPVAPLVLALAVVLVAAKLGGDIAVRVRQPAVLGELVAGVLLGNLQLVGVDAFQGLLTDVHLDMLARLGVLLLLFEVGLESTVKQMLQVGLSSLLVALVGVAAPMALGVAAGALLLPQASLYVHLFIGATLCATSVGITARVLQDLGAQQSTSARIILGAAVIDDVLGLVVLAVVAGVIAAADAGGAVSVLDALVIIGKATLFLVGSLVIGVLVSHRLFRVASYLRTRGVLLATGLAFCFVLAWAADAIGLAPIVGAFAAGLILEEVHYKDFRARGEEGLEKLVQPITSFLVPVFFVLMGMRTDLRAFADPSILALAAALTAAAVAGKQACALAVLPKQARDASRLVVGIGMIPRGEVGLIFANIGLTLTVAGERIVSPEVFSACVAMVILTTLMTPPLLRWAIGRTTPALPAPGA